MSSSKPNKAIGPQVRQKNPGKLNHPLVLLVILSFLISMQIGTQFFAHQFHYADDLGFSLAHIYMPWQIFIWAIKYQPYYPDSFTAAFGLIVMSGCLFLMMIVLASKYFKKSNVSDYLHGSARWANLEDLNNASLIGHD